MNREGWLLKQGGVIKTWKKRWFRLDGFVLRCYERPGKEQSGVIKLGEATEISLAPECKRQPAFKIVVPSQRTYYLVGDTIDMCKDWIAAMQPVKGTHLKLIAAHQINNITKVTLDDFDVLKLLGKGSYGKVYLVRFKKDKQLYAMKAMSKRLIEDQDQIDAVLLEKEMLLKTRNPFMVSAQFSFQTNSKVFIVQDYVPGGELSCRMKTERKFKEEDAVFYAAEIVHALGYLHKKGYIYRDLKAENILVDRDGHLKIADFGLCKANMQYGNTTSTFCGTPDYMAPEVVSRQQYKKSVDWWSLGVLIFEMIVGYPPFYNENTKKMYDMIMKEEVLVPVFVSEQAKQIILRLLDKNPDTRLGAGERDWEEIKEMSFFSSVNWYLLENKRVKPPWIPTLYDDTDTSNFSKQFDNEKDILIDDKPMLGDQNIMDIFKGFSSVATSIIEDF